MSPFPLDLIGYSFLFLDPVNDCDAETLRACALVCRSWTHLSQSRLFQALDVPLGTFPVLLGHLSRFTHLSRLVQEVHIGRPISDDFWDPVARRRDRNVFHTVPSLLPNVTTLTYSGTEPMGYEWLGVFQNMDRLILHKLPAEVGYHGIFAPDQGLQRVEMTIRSPRRLPLLVNELIPLTFLHTLRLEYTPDVFTLRDNPQTTIKTVLNRLISSQDSLVTLEIVLPSDVSTFPSSVYVPLD
jgi:hypothetical protein